jgi:hypothetical protein
MLHERPFWSCEIPSGHSTIVKAACAPILDEDLGTRRFSLCWVPYTINSSQSVEQIMVSQELLNTLLRDQTTFFEYMTIEDEYWFVLDHSHDANWVESRDELPGRTKHAITPDECRVWAMWPGNGIRRLLDGPKGAMSNSSFFSHAVVPGLIENVWSHSR